MPRTWPLAESDPGVCTRCAEQGRTCCNLTPGQEELCFPLSKVEWDRILEVVGEQGAFVQSPNAASFRANMRRLFPREEAFIDRLFPNHGVHLRLATRPDGSCALLGPEGCTLPREARPYYCRVFPFWVVGEKLTMFTPDYCLAIQERPRIGQLLAGLELTEKSVFEMHGRLRLAWGLPPKPGQKVVETVFTRNKK